MPAQPALTIYPQVRRFEHETGLRYALEVEERGIGLRAGDLARLFPHFYRMVVQTLLILMLATQAIADPEGGSGINLAALENWQIVVDSAAIPSERYAAIELQHFLALATGTNLPIADSAGNGTGCFFVGPDAVEKAGKLAFVTDDLVPEDLRIVARDNVIAIAGGRPRGTLYGVYTFLEDYAGVRFLAPDCTHVPRLKKPSVIGPMERTFHPPVALRWTYYGEMNNPVFAARMRCNMIPNEPQLGGKSQLRLINHTFARYVPWSKYGSKHPEYFNRDENPGDQPCLTNPDVLRLVTEAVLAELECNPELKNVSVSQNDNTNYCRCERCREIDRREGSQMGSLLTFVNAVAAEVAKRHPDVMVGTLAYKYSRRPPRNLRPLPNVQIQLCSIECCMNHAMDDPECPLNAPFCGDMEAWSKICDDIYIWHYIVNFANYHVPCPNIETIAPDVRWFVDHGAKGIMLQGAWNTSGGEFSELRNYVGSRLLWNPSLNGARLIDEFLDLYYQEAAPPIREFLEFARSKAHASGRHERCSRPASHYGLDREVGLKGLDLFLEAEGLAATDKIRRRVEKAGICAQAMMAEAVIDPADRHEMLFEIVRHGGTANSLKPHALAEAMPFMVK